MITSISALFWAFYCSFFWRIFPCLSILLLFLHLFLYTGRAATSPTLEGIVLYMIVPLGRPCVQVGDIAGWLNSWLQWTGDPGAFYIAGALSG